MSSDEPQSVRINTTVLTTFFAQTRAAGTSATFRFATLADQYDSGVEEDTQNQLNQQRHSATQPKPTVSLAAY